MQDTRDLMDAIDDKSLACLKLLVNDYEVDVNCSDEFGRFALCHAIRSGFEEGALYLLESGASVNVQETWGEEDTPLHLAVKTMNKTILEKVLTAVEDVGVMNCNNLTPLEIACNNDFQFAVEQLMFRGDRFVSIDVINYVLSLAVEKKDLDLMKKIKGMIEDFPTFENTKSSPLHLAARSNFEHGLDLLLEWGADVNARNNEDCEQNTPLHIAIENRNIDVVKFLLKNGARGDICNRTGETALHLAIQFEFKEALDLLLKNDSVQLTGKLGHRAGNNAVGAHVNCRNYVDETPMHFAVENFRRFDLLKAVQGMGLGLGPRLRQELRFVPRLGDWELVEHGLDDKNAYERLMNIFNILLKHPETNINAKQFEGKTPLHIACKWRAHEVVELLLSKGALVNETDKEGNTALHVAMYENDIFIIPILLKYGARGDLQNYLSNSVMHLVVSRRLGDVFDKMIEYNSIQNINQKDQLGNTILHIAIEHKMYKTCQRIVSEKADVSQLNKLGVSPLIYSIINDFPEGTKLLLCSGASANENPMLSAYSAPIYEAVECKNETILRILLEAGANVNSSVVHESPLHVAARVNFKEGANILLNAGADANATDCNHKTPLDVALERKHTGVAYLLQKNNELIDVMNGPKENTRPFCVECGMKIFSLGQNQTLWCGMSFQYFEMIERNALRNCRSDQFISCDNPCDRRGTTTPCDRFLQDLINEGDIDNLTKYEIGEHMLVSGFIPLECRSVYSDMFMYERKAACNAGLSKIGSCILKLHVAEKNSTAHFTCLYYFRGSHRDLYDPIDPCSSYLESCQKEISRLENITIRKVSLFDLFLDWKDPTAVLEKTKPLIDTLPIEELFPIYEKVIKQRVKTLETRRDLLKTTMNTAFLKGGNGPTVPPETKIKILNELADEDLMAVMLTFIKKRNMENLEGRRLRGSAPWRSVTFQDIELWFDTSLTLPIGTAIVPESLCLWVLTENNIQKIHEVFEENGLTDKLNLLIPLRESSQLNSQESYWSLLVLYSQLFPYQVTPCFYHYDSLRTGNYDLALRLASKLQSALLKFVKCVKADVIEVTVTHQRGSIESGVHLIYNMRVVCVSVVHYLSLQKNPMFRDRFDVQDYYNHQRRLTLGRPKEYTGWEIDVSSLFRAS